jgi:hypothetical protein
LAEPAMLAEVSLAELPDEPLEESGPRRFLLRPRPNIAASLRRLTAEDPCQVDADHKRCGHGDWRSVLKF